MACGGHCNVCPAHPGYDPPLSVVSWTDPIIDTDSDVKIEHFNELKYYIDFEFTRRGLSPSAGFPSDDKTSVDVVHSVDYKTNWDHIKAIDKTWTPANSQRPNLNVGHDILDESTEDMRTQIDTLRVECLCNCNYSCTCNCNYCTCNCNYACTCDCNYSDRRLKTDIKYL